MEANVEILTSHVWQMRDVELEGSCFRLRSCVQCGRDFVEEPSTHELYAVHVSAFHLDRLADGVTRRWREDPCPSQRLMLDQQDRTTKPRMQKAP